MFRSCASQRQSSRTNGPDLEPAAVARAQEAEVEGAAEGPIFVTDNHLLETPGM